MIRIAICQPGVPKYRIPVFNLLAQQPGIDLTLYADTQQWAAPPADELKFKFIPAPITHKNFGPVHTSFQQAQLDVVDSKNFEMVILPWDAHYTSLRPAIQKACAARIPVILWGHGYSKRDSAFRTYMRNRIARRGDGVLLYTRSIADRLVSKYHFDPQHVFTAQNAIDQAPVQAARKHWTDRPAELAAFQQKHNLDPTCTLLFVSRLLEENRTELLIDAVKSLSAEFPRVKAVIVGGGPDEARLKAHAQSAGVADRILFTGPIYEEMQLAPWALSSTLFCYPVNIGLSIFTAFGYGLPVITSDNIAGQNPEIEALRHNANGLLYRDGDPAALLAACRSILADPALRARLSAEATRTATEIYSIRNMVQGFLDATRLVDGVQRTCQ